MFRGIGMDEDIYAEFEGSACPTGSSSSPARPVPERRPRSSALNETKSEDTKIITTEDPIEYQLNGINQTQVHTKVGLTFRRAARLSATPLMSQAKSATPTAENVHSRSPLICVQHAAHQRCRARSCGWPTWASNRFSSVAPSNA